MFKIGDEVRLNRGWTRLVVIEVLKNGTIRAKYDHDGLRVLERVKNTDFENPQHAHSTQLRNALGFTKWDGAPAKKVYYTMPGKTYYVTSPGEHPVGSTGTYLATDAEGHVVLQMYDRSICFFKPEEVSTSRIVPKTFAVKSVANNYRCHYEVPADKKGPIVPGALLLSESGNLYVVTHIDTKMQKNKGPFKGCRLITGSL